MIDRDKLMERGDLRKDVKRKNDVERRKEGRKER